MARSARQLLKPSVGSPSAPGLNLISVDSLLEFECNPGQPPEHEPLCRLLVRLDVAPEDRVVEEGPRILSRLLGVRTTGLGVGRAALPVHIEGWLSERQDQLPITVVLLDPDGCNRGLEAKVFGELRQVSGEIHVVSERALDPASDDRLRVDSVVQATAGLGPVTASRLFSTLAADTAPMLWTCRDELDWRPAYGTANHPSWLVQAWWDVAAQGLVFETDTDRSLVAGSPAVMATLYERHPFACREWTRALRAACDPLAHFAYGLPVDFLRITDSDPAGKRLVHLLCADARRPAQSGFRDGAPWAA